MTPKRLLVATVLFGLFVEISMAQAQQPLGRLFFTPEERARLDASRKEALANAARPKAAAPAAAPRPAPTARVLTLNGIVHRSDGETIIWVNGKPVPHRGGAATVAPGSVGADTAGLVLTESGRRVRLKVGQSVEANSAVVEEGYKRRRTLPTAVAAPPPAAAEPAGQTPPEEAGTDGSRR
jgi:hypothetical protein